MTEQRATIRRSINSFGMRGGEFQESKAWASVGKGLIVWLIIKHADALISHSDTLLVLLAMIILPDIAKKMLTMRYGNMTTESTERTERITTAEGKDQP